MKKIIAGLLASASLLAMSVSASAAATTKNVTKAGELTYDVAVAAPKVVLNLTMPAKMSAQLNPYKAEVKLEDKEEDAVTTTAGIASVGYEIVNASTDYGVYIDASAITTVTTTDKTKWTVTGAKPTAGTKSAQMALVGANALDALKAAMETDGAFTSAAATADAQGVLAMDSTVAADKENGIAKGQTTKKKVFYIPAKTTTDGKIFIGFGGQLAASATASEVEWKEDDAINVSLVLKVVAGPKTFPTT